MRGKTMQEIEDELVAEMVEAGKRDELGTRKMLTDLVETITSIPCGEGNTGGAAAFKQLLADSISPEGQRQWLRTVIAEVEFENMFKVLSGKYPDKAELRSLLERSTDDEIYEMMLKCADEVVRIASPMAVGVDCAVKGRDVIEHFYTKERLAYLVKKEVAEDSD